LTGACDAQVADYVIPRDAVAIVVVEWTKPIGGMKIVSRLSTLGSASTSAIVRR